MAQKLPRRASRAIPRQPLRCPLLELADQALDRLGCAVDVAEEAHLAVAPRRGQRDEIFSFEVSRPT
jgi:hypothetical protein